MRTILLLAFALIFSEAIAIGNNHSLIGVWSNFEGKVNKKQGRLSIYVFKDGKVSGNWVNKVCDSKLNIVGKLSDQILALKVYNGGGKVIGYCYGKVTKDSINNYVGYYRDSLSNMPTPL